MALPRAGRGQDAQDTLESPQSKNAETTPVAAKTTLHGVVLNTATGEPLPRALVRVLGEGDVAGALTDGEGRFAIADVALGPQQIEAQKPGFLDEMAETAARGQWNETDFAHTVLVAAGAPDLELRLEPANSIRGQVMLSTGETARDIQITLLKQTVDQGRTTWQVGATGTTNADGVYRFGGLADGQYALYSAPEMENGPGMMLAEPGRTRNVEHKGYPSLFYPQAHDLAGAAKIAVQGGIQTEANLTLTIEPFYQVSATIPSVEAAAETELPFRFGPMYSAQVTDSEGHPLAYVAIYDPRTHTVQASLPNGNYMFVVAGTQPRLMLAQGLSPMSMAMPERGRMAGALEFSVAGRSVSNLRIPVAPVSSGTVEVNLTRTSAHAEDASASTEDAQAVTILLSQAGGSVGFGMISQYAHGPLSGPLTTQYVPPGTYWAHTNVADQHICVGSLSAGGANLAREPLVVSTNGPSVPLAINLRDDCARLTLNLPAAAAGTGVGEEPFYTVYVVPEIDSTEDVVPRTLRGSTGGIATLDDLTPGSYRVYVFDKPVALAYHDRDALQSLPGPGQTVELAPGSSVTLVLEVPSHE
ncbi:MAG: carboxypeptidase-like regulatory domain-containing protein [Terracidiphilus sp.]